MVHREPNKQLMSIKTNKPSLEVAPTTYMYLALRTRQKTNESSAIAGMADRG